MRERQHWMVVCCLGAFACAGQRSRPPPRVVVVDVAEADEPDPHTSSTPPEVRIASEHDSDLQGQWEGTGIQNDGQSWPIVVIANGNRRGECATAEYPSIPCAAVWYCTGEDTDGTVLGREQLTDGLDRCIDSGTLTMRLSAPGELRMSWEGGGITAEATLRRAR
jgi:hypothetical protein